MSKKVRTRIAPSPTGQPHIGTAYAALFNYCFAKRNKGDFILRIEDTDRTRYVEGSEEEIIKSLLWLGLTTDEDPLKGGAFGPYRQSERLEIYERYAKELVAKDKAYYCDCSPERLAQLREEQQARRELPHYDRKCRYDPPKKLGNSVVRLAIPLDGETSVEDKIRGEIKFQNKIIDDQVLLKSDGFPTYHLASVVDDHLMEISHVIRAEEWLSSTPKHVLLYQAFGWNLPEFAHLPLLRNRDKSKISKRKNPVTLDFYRQEGYLPKALVNFLALMGWSMPNEKEIFALEEVVENFTFERIDPSGPVFDIQKLDWLNGEYIRASSVQELVRLLREGYTKYSEEQVTKVLPLVKERMKKLSEFDLLVGFFFEEEIELDKELINQKGKDKIETSRLLEELARAFEETKWYKQDIEDRVRKTQEKIGWSNSDLFMSIRTAISGSRATPPLFDTLELVGKERTIKRLKAAALLLK